MTDILWIVIGIAVIDIITLWFTIDLVSKKTKERVTNETKADLIKKAVDREYDELDGVLYIRDDGQAIGCWCDLYKDPNAYKNGERLIFLVDTEEE